MNENRIIYIDYIETIAIFLVVICHIAITAGRTVGANILLQLATTLGVPLFFMANGALLFNQKFDLKKHLKKIFWMFITLVSWKLLYLLAILIKDFEKARLLSAGTIFAYIGGGNITDPYVPAEHFWFLYGLIAIYLLFPFIKKFFDIDQKTVYYFLILLFIFRFAIIEYQDIASILEIKGNLSLPALDIYMESFGSFNYNGTYLFYFVIGGLLHKKWYQPQVKRIKKQALFLPLIIAFIAFIGMLILKYLQEDTLAGQWVRLNDDYSRISTMILSISVFIWFLKVGNFPNKRINQINACISQRTMNIYAVHMMLCFIYAIYVFPRFPYQGIVIHLLRSLLVVMASLVITEPLRFIPGIRKLLGIKPTPKKEIGVERKKGWIK